MSRGAVAVAFLSLIALFVASEPIVTTLCSGGEKGVCSGAGGRFALIALLRACLGVPIAFLVWRPRRYVEVGIDRRRSAVLLGLLAALLITARIHDHFDGVAAEFARAMWQSAGLPWLFALAMVVAAPALEELVFRGLLFDLFSGRGWWLAIGGSAMAWAALHLQYDAAGILLLLWLGCILGAARLFSGGVAVPVLMHAGWNLRVLMALAAA